MGIAPDNAALPTTAPLTNTRAIALSYVAARWYHVSGWNRNGARVTPFPCPGLNSTSDPSSVVRKRRKKFSRPGVTFLRSRQLTPPAAFAKDLALNQSSIVIALDKLY